MDLRRSRRDHASSLSLASSTTAAVMGRSYRSIDLHVLQSKVQKAIEAASMTVLKNADHCRTLSEGLWTSFKAGHMVDIAIHCHGHSTRAHRVVLSVFSPVLRSFMAPPPLPPPPPPPPTTTSDDRSGGLMLQSLNVAPPLCICLDDVVNRAHDLDILLEFMYRGEVSLPKTGLQSLLRTAEILEIWCLVDAIKEQHEDDDDDGVSNDQDPGPNGDGNGNSVVEQMTIKLEPTEDLHDDSMDMDHFNVGGHFKADSAATMDMEDVDQEPPLLNAPRGLQSSGTCNCGVNAHLNNDQSHIDDDNDDNVVEAGLINVPKRHPKDVTSKVKVRFRCQYCSKAFSSNQAYVVHHMEHADPASRQNRENQCPTSVSAVIDGHQQQDARIGVNTTASASQDLVPSSVIVHNRFPAEVPIQLIKSNKGKDLLVHQDYIYRLDRVRGGSRYWRCNHYDSCKCKARSVTIANIVSEVRGTHNHPPEKATVDAKQIHASIKDLAKTDESVQSIIAQTVNIHNPSVSSTLPKENAIRRIIRRSRSELTAPTNPSNLLELAIPHMYSTTLNNEDFLMFDSGPSEDRIVLFSTNHNLQLLQDSPHWYADGTIKVTPPLFQQLYAIHVIKFGGVVPTVFLLLPDKRSETYERALNALKSIRPNLNPSTILTNFETEETKALAACFEDAVQRGCRFHFGNTIWNRIRHHHVDIEQQYKVDKQYALNLRQLLCLCFVPLDQIVVKFEELCQSDFFRNADSSSSSLRQLLDHFEETFIGCRASTANQGLLQDSDGSGGRRRSPPIFEHSFWNCYDLDVDEDVDVNAAIESWHRRFESLVDCSRPSIWKFIVKLKREQASNDQLVLQLMAGVRPSPSKCQLNAAKRSGYIRTVVEEFANCSFTEYLTALALHVDFYV